MRILSFVEAVHDDNEGARMLHAPFLTAPCQQTRETERAERRDPTSRKSREALASNISDYLGHTARGNILTKNSAGLRGYRPSRVRGEMPDQERIMGGPRSC